MKSLFARRTPEPVKRKVNLADPERLAALKRLKIMDTPPEESLDRLTRVAAKVVGAPVALLTLVDSHRQFFKSAYGLPKIFEETRQTPVTYSFCQHVVLDQKPMIVSDARLDPRLKENPAIEMLGVLAYAGMPVFAPSGEPLGSFCVMDTHVREWEPEQMAILKDLAASVMAELDARQISLALIEQEETRIELGEEISDEVMAAVRALIVDLKEVMRAKTIGPAITDAILSTHRIGVRLGDLSDVASYAADAVSPLQRRNSVKDMMLSAAKSLEKLSGELQVKIEVNIPPDLPLVLANAASLERVFRILFRQALRFTEPGGLVKAWAKVEERMVACYISNSSPMQEDSIHSAWEHRKKDSENPRLSVGLAFCGRVIEDHGGTIGVSTTPEGGSVMRLTLTQIPPGPKHD